MKDRPEALLLLGPTAVGKTPLGRILLDRGLGSRKCCHFDFGDLLRTAARGSAGLSPVQVEIIRRRLESGSLLEDDEFPIALALLRRFLAEHSLSPRDLVVLNGLPRHEGQAVALERWLQVETLVLLEADAATIMERIRRDSGGDRRGRRDDGREEVLERLRLYEERTLPLVVHYRSRGLEPVVLKVGVETTALELASRLERRLTSSLPGPVSQGPDPAR
jgi:adenylate kinase family enzyme